MRESGPHTYSGFARYIGLHSGLIAVANLWQEYDSVQKAFKTRKCRLCASDSQRNIIEKH